MTAPVRYIRDLGRETHGPNLADMGRKLAGQLAELSARPTVDGCDRMIRELADASTEVHKMREHLERGRAA